MAIGAPDVIGFRNFDDGRTAVNDLDRLRARQASYLTGHYLGLHAMVVSIALGIGVIAAGATLSLFLTERPGLRHFGTIYLLMLATSFLAVVVVYAGPLHGAIFLPGGLPSVFDLLVPLIVGLAEFALFGILASVRSDWMTPRIVVASWWSAIAVLGTAGAAQIIRAHYLISHAVYDEFADPLRRRYLRRVKVQAAGAGMNGVAGTVLALLALFAFDTVDVIIHTVACAVALGFFVVATWGHRTTWRIIRNGLA